MKIILMCQGDQSRLPSLNGFPKQLIPIKGEPNLARTLRLIDDSLLHQGCQDVHIVAANTETWRQFTREHETWLYTQSKVGRCIVHGLLHTSCLWNQDGRTIVLLGDVVFSRITIKAILENRDPLALFGQAKLNNVEGEMFGLAFDADQRETILDHIVALRCWSDSDEHQPGHLRNLLWSLNPHGAGNFQLGNLLWLPYFVPVGVHTDDIDTEEDLVNLPQLEAVID